MLYAPFGHIYGSPDYQALVSLLATDFQESREFISQIPIKVFLKAILVPVTAYCAYKLAVKINIKPWKNKTIVLLTSAAFTISLKPTLFIEHTYKSYIETEKSLNELAKYISKPEWKMSEYLGQREKDYILIIGESARKDYFHTYGYPVPNTPFLDTVNAIKIDGLTAGGVYTIGSLTNMLTMGDTKNWKPNYARNIIDLANDAKIDTFWISNQGFVGIYDTPVSSIGTRAKHVKFLNKRAYDKANHSDHELLA